MNDSGSTQNDVSDELRKLGENINQFIKTAWETPERQKIQQEIESSLNTLGTSLNQAADEFSKSPAGQQIKTDLDDFGQRLNNGQVEERIKSEVSNILNLVNQHLEKTTRQWKESSSGSPTQPQD
ncbi:MAG: hypothetical protein LWX83_07700 [Anaerolineae bacterium]|nr:hypothetical protein [Anaerolineae bacterium]